MFCFNLYTDLQLLEQKYPSLCEICYNPWQCGINDKHWGRRGPLNCLTAGVGEIAWTRLDDVRSHFGVRKQLLNVFCNLSTTAFCSLTAKRFAATK